MLAPGGPSTGLLKTPGVQAVTHPQEAGPSYFQDNGRSSSVGAATGSLQADVGLCRAL